MEVANQTTKIKANDVVSVKCDCCGLTEECTEEYARRVRDRYSGRWICGLCGEAVKYEMLRSNKKIGPEEALSQHMNFCRKFKARSPPKNPTEDLIDAVKHLLLRSLDSPRSSPVRKPVRAPSQSRVTALGSGA
ncbi:Protein of unknown function (DUF1677 [Striga hermonthica]|uniref:DUF1677 family protein n=1 Tax=Striga hermonthica TaxID=68872 RepID=A0A9N7N4W3_STRHE|nr:Protein of unknown function (DUF1677 [Striga hermonthica]